MSDFWKFANEKIPELKNLGRDAMLYRALPHFFMELMEKYFRISVEGTENLLAKGGGLIAPNHSGYAGLDAMLLSHLVHKNTGRIAKVMTHHFWFLTKTTSVPAQKLGFVEATKKNGLDFLKKKHLVVLFPEGEHGNFKPTSKAYRLQEFKRGFVRMALQTKQPIIPTIIIGAEETHINLKQLKFTKYLRGTVLPLPLNVLPLPAKWKIVFLEPIYLPHKPEAANDAELVHEISTDIRERMQNAINKELRGRDSIFL